MSKLYDSLEKSSDYQFNPNVNRSATNDSDSNGSFCLLYQIVFDISQTEPREFDVKIMAGKMIAMHKKYVNSDRPDVKITLFGRTVSSKGELFDDLYMMTAIGGTRGTNIGLILETSKPNLKAYLSELQFKYEISNGKPDVSSVTLARIPVLIAPIMFKFAVSKVARSIVSMKDLWGGMIPDCLNHNFLAPVWPDEFTREYIYLMQYRIFSLMCSVPDHPKRHIKAYCKAAIKNSIFNNTFRCTLFTKFKLMKDGKPSEKMAKALAIATKKWKQLEDVSYWM